MSDHPLSPNLGPAFSGDIAPVDYLEWYVPRLIEGVTHDLSQSGLHFDWDWNELMKGEINAGLTNPFDPPLNGRDLVAQREGVEPNRIAGGHGVSQSLILALLASAKGDAPRKVAVEMPSYAPVAQFPRTLGYEVVPFYRGPQSESDCGPWLINRESLLSIISDVCAVVTTPMQNPTGWMMDERDQEWLVDVCASHGLPLISDEVYIDSARGSRDYRPMHRYGEHCISVNSLTKCYGLGPLRVGWIVASPNIANAAIRAVHNMQGSLATPSLRMAELAWAMLDEPLELIRRRRDENLPILVEMLADRGIDWTPPPSGIFGCIPLPEGVDSQLFVEQVCAKKGLLATPCLMFDASLSRLLRIGWGGEPEDFKAAITALGEALDEIGE